MHRLAFATLLVAATASAHPPVGVALPPPSTTPRAAAPPPTITSWLDDARARLAADKLDGWLLADELGRNPVAVDVVQPRGPLHRWFFLIPPTGEPQLVCHAADVAAFDARKPLVYRSWRELDAQLKLVLRGKKRVAMEWSPRLPARSFVDGGTIDLVRAAGAQPVSSGDLVTLMRARWSDAQLRSHQVAAGALVAVKDDAFAFIGNGHGRVTEYDVQQRVLRSLATHGLEPADVPVVAAGVHSADPAYVPTPEHSERIAPGDVVILSVAARQKGVADAVVADMSWVGFVGDRVSDEAARLYAIAADMRSRVQSLVEERLRKKLPVRGFELDDAARAVAAKAGFGDRVLRPTGHSLSERRFGDGPNLDDVGVLDERRLLPRTGYVVEPALYVAGAFGVRASIDLYIAADGSVRVTPESPEREIEPIPLR